MPASKLSAQLLPNDFYDITEADIARAAEEQALGMVAPSDPILVKIAQEVLPEQIAGEDIQQVISDLYEAAQGQRKGSRNNKKRRMLVGLAAPQIQKSLRIVLIDTGIDFARKRTGKLECFINPKIVWRSRETEEGREGCFSAGPVWGLVRRPVAVKIRAIDISGKPIERILEGFTARIAQHEIDHLNGIRFPDRIKTDRKRHWVHAEEIALYPKLIKHWPRLCSKEHWNQLKQV
ncbi:MAG: peptide deformylase [Candidatus Saccharimonadales bacterium]